MSRESQEVSEQEHNEQFGTRGLGDPDAYGYPGEPKTLSELVAALGAARIETNNAYERYKELRDIQDQLRYELENKLRSDGLKSAKGVDFTASISEKPTIVIRNEATIIEWLKHTPDVESDQYIGLKATEFKSLALSMLKGSGEIVPGAEVEVKESLSIRSNKKPVKVQG